VGHGRRKSRRAWWVVVFEKTLHQGERGYEEGGRGILARYVEVK
jgi:hypothetical protein